MSSAPFFFNKLVDYLLISQGTIKDKNVIEFCIKSQLIHRRLSQKLLNKVGILERRTKINRFIDSCTEIFIENEIPVGINGLTKGKGKASPVPVKNFIDNNLKTIHVEIDYHRHESLKKQAQYNIINKMKEATSFNKESFKLGSEDNYVPKNKITYKGYILNRISLTEAHEIYNSYLFTKGRALKKYGFLNKGDFEYYIQNPVKTRNHHVINFLREITGNLYLGYKRTKVIRSMGFTYTENNAFLKNFEPKIIYRLDFATENKFRKAVQRLSLAHDKMIELYLDAEKNNILNKRKERKLAEKMRKSRWGEEKTEESINDLNRYRKENPLIDVNKIKENANEKFQKMKQYESRKITDLENYNVLDDIRRGTLKPIAEEVKTKRIVNRVRFRGVKRRTYKESTVVKKADKKDEPDSIIAMKKAFQEVRERIKKSIGEKSDHPSFDVENPRHRKKIDAIKSRVSRRVENFKKFKDYASYIYIQDMLTLEEKEVDLFYLKQLVGPENIAKLEAVKDSQTRVKDCESIELTEY